MSSSGNATSSRAQYSAARLGSVIYLSIVGTVGLIANGLVIAAFWKYRKLRIATKNLFILNLAVCDLVLAILDTVFSISSSLHGRWLFGETGCNIYGFFHYFFISNTVSTLAAISVDRFYYITKPGRVHTAIITKTRAGIMIGIVYIYTFVFTIPPAIGWNSFVEEKHFFSGCYIDYSDQNAASIAYSITASTCLFLVPLAIMLYCYIKIFLAVRKSTHRTISRQSSSIGIPGSTMKKKFPLMKRTHVQTAKLIIVAVFFSMNVWVPHVTVSLAKAFSGGNGISPLASHITVLIAKSCVIYNVLIYVVLNRKFKAAVLDMICCGKTPGGSYGLGTCPRQRLSRILSDTDRELPSQLAENQRNRLNVLNSPKLRLQSRSLPNGFLEAKASDYLEGGGIFVSSVDPSTNRYGAYSHKSVEFEDVISFENLVKGDDKLRLNGQNVKTRNEPESDNKTMKTLKSNLKSSQVQGEVLADNAKVDTASSSNSKESEKRMEQTSDLEVSTTGVNNQADLETKSFKILSEARWKGLGKIRALSRRQLPDTPQDVNFKKKCAPGNLDASDNVLKIPNGKVELLPPVKSANKANGAQWVISTNPIATEPSTNDKRTDSPSPNGGMLSSYKLVRAASQRKPASTVPEKPVRHLNSNKEVLNSRASIRSLYSRHESFRCRNDTRNPSRTSEHQRSCSPGDGMPQKRQSRTRRNASHRDGIKRTKHGARTSRTNSSVKGRAANLGQSLSADSLKTPPKELENIQNYWKRMSLCLDDIDLDAENQGVSV